ncbi:MAG: hypothetical protein JXJ20_01045 [Anaerolineae bacterium]|jgi:hypothetical protein|nr:hypothetical protein [Anaerolineae bacterium]
MMMMTGAKLAGHTGQPFTHLGFELLLTRIRRVLSGSGSISLILIDSGDIPACQREAV